MNNPIIYNTLLVWKDVGKYLNNIISLRSPITRKACQTLTTLFRQDTVKSFDQIRTDFEISNNDIFKFLQLQYIINS